MNIHQQIAQELNCQVKQVDSAIALLNEGATVPFIARYRKEVTGGLDDGQLRQLEERLRYLTELSDRKQSIIGLIDEQGKLTDELKGKILACDNKATLEDLYLPYKTKRRTKGQIAIEAGLLPLAESLLAERNLNPQTEATKYINAAAEFADEKAVLDGAKYILMEQFAQDAELLGRLREYLWREALLVSAVMAGQEQAGEKFRDYFEFSQAIKDIPSHRALALFRGRNEAVLSLNLQLDLDDKTAATLAEQYISEQLALNLGSSACDAWLSEVVKWTWRIKLKNSMETELFNRLREAAEDSAIDVFAKNLKDLLLAAPAGAKTTLGLDPGFRTGVKVAVVDASGKILDHGAIYPHEPKNQWNQSQAAIAGLIKKHKIELIAIGNGTASRETDKLVAELLKQDSSLKCKKVMVSEAGASVYSASETAAKEFPDLDVTIRGAISIARRLQDPLAELVKIEPKAIGVGQYQHDVNQISLSRSLDAVVEDCVNGVGVDLNTASAPLLARVSGLNQTIANNIVSFREENGQFASRTQLKKVPRLGPKAFEQAAGFLRIAGGKNPLDASGVHPESYALVEQIVKSNSKAVNDVIGDTLFLRSLNAKDYVTEQFGLPTVKDILSELDKPGRDPRPEFVTAEFADGVNEIKDLVEGMILQGVVTNVTNFGAFVDVGVHQDGLVHISAMSDKFISNPADVVKAGDIVKVKVMEVDAPRKRIGLSMRLNDEVSPASSSDKPQQRRGQRKSAKQSFGQKATGQQEGTLGALLQQAMNKKK